MENSNIACPVCTLFLREGVTLQAHLDTHPKDQVIEALLKVSRGASANQTSSAPVSNSSHAPVQSASKSNSSFISSSPQGLLHQPPQTLLNVNTPSQLTTAVTYQHFMTSNGSAILPQYIQVPIINPSCNTPLISNSMNLVPNQTVNYSQTSFNPLYNPYIPQPYPFTQPVFTSFPTSTIPVIENNTQTQTVNSSSEQSSVLSSVIVKKSSVSTSTVASKKVYKAKTKRNLSKEKAAQDDPNPATLKPTEPVKTAEKPNITLTKLSYKGKKTDLSTPSTSSESEIGLSSLNQNLERTECIPHSKSVSPPPLPPLTRAPYFSGSLSEGEDVLDSAGPSFVRESVSVDRVISQHPKAKTVICNSASLKNCSNNETLQEPDDDKISEDCISEKMVENESSKDPLEFNDSMIEFVKKNQEEIEDEGCDKGTKTKVFEMIEFSEDCKNEAIRTVVSQDIPKEIRSENIERNCDGSDIFIQQENIVFNESSSKESSTDNSYPEFIDVQTIETVKTQPRNENQNEFSFYNEELENTSVKPVDSLPVTYTDLQPAKNSRVFQDLGISPYLNFNNFMEVDGIKIFFNSNSSNSQFEPVVKLTNIQPSDKSIPESLKSENQLNSHAVVESVIQIVPGEIDSKSDIAFRENYSSTSSHVNDMQLDLPDLSPLALNIQADESMPARGELSEQESLGAENSSWSLFHGTTANDTKSLEEWRSRNLETVSVIEDKKSEKLFKCSTCNEVFSCPKERRIHKNAVHLNKTEKVNVNKKEKTYACTFCGEVFPNIRDRKIHYTQNHIADVKNNQNQIKEESTECIDLEANVKNEGVQEGSVKTEQALSTAEIDSQRIKYCSRCSLPFMGIKKLREHLRLVHEEIRFKCDTCNECFDEEYEYNNHLLIHPLICDKCGKKFHRKPNLNIHMKRHLDVKPYECNLCPKSFITRQKLEEHMNGHSGKKPIKCSLCDKTFNRHSNLVQHRNSHHLMVKKKIKDFVCRCGEVFHSLRKLEWHKEVHESKPKPCPFCSQKFIHSASVTRHIRRAHLPEYLPGDNREFDNVQCPICEKLYLRSSLVVHMRVHKGEKPFGCKICNKRFSTKWNLELHNWTHQSRSNMPYKCTICKSAFFRESDFVAHVNSHKNVKPFTCNICGQKFIRKYSCLRHQEEHKKNKQYVCGVSGCGKSFHRGYYLRDHMKVHTGVRPHTCHICGKASSTKSNHNKHVRIHDTREPVNTEN